MLQSGKMAIAAVGAWLIAGRLLPQESFLAPYSAVFVMSTTVYRSMTNAVRQVLALGLGVLLAFAAGQLIPHPVVALGVGVLVGMLVGQWQPLGPSGVWVGVTALLVITIGHAEQPSYLAYRMAASTLGAVVGLGVNLLVFPPVHLRLPERAVAALGVELRDLLSDICRGLQEGVQRDDAIGWLHRARALDTAIRRAHDAVLSGREHAAEPAVVRAAAAPVRLAR